MRGGYFLAEESPERLISQFGCASLEDVFLKLSVIQNMGKRRRSSILQGVTEAIQVPTGTINEAAVIDDEVGEISGEFGDNVSMSSRGRVSIAPEPTENAPPELPPEEDPPMACADYFKIVTLTHMHALIWKNFLWMWRNAPVMTFITLLPVVQIILFCLSIGHSPSGLSLSVVNHELQQSETCELAPGCNSTRLSCNYLTFLENRTLQLSFYASEEEGKEIVRRGNAWAALVFASNFSDSIRSRIEGGRNVPDWDLVTSSVEVYQDKSNENIGSYIQRDLYFAFEDFFKEYLVSCNIDSKIGSIPIKWERPIYGYDSTDFTDFAAPGVMLTIIFFLAVALTSGAMLLERNEGILERSLVNGINGVELLFSHVITQFTVMFGQSAMVLFFSFYIFGITQNGNLLLVVILIIMTGLCGMCFGFVVSCSCDNERSATYMAMGSFLPIVMLCGIIWPIEAMHNVLKIISYVLPLTKSTESLRCILARGWSIETPEVYEGFIATLIWIVVFLTISILLLKFKKG
ncbi:hypothetical protein GEV33_002072 [Tenebrio molitor]|uniref:ABC transmembrane type-2 domain-containing protein n=2 Tax=Tenebrio molitor TaxID=7067 RepID=A0A8J6LF49_TENMO|nr:hypothetical protein GEV33_003531 [Tenebrio molitor]KAH0820719.1 hypothetical protein GEV33_002072 [Tenebrio molitor]